MSSSPSTVFTAIASGVRLACSATRSCSGSPGYGAAVAVHSSSIRPRCSSDMSGSSDSRSPGSAATAASRSR
ncbi:hypothetical protein [Nonomuraea recticatena]|uniref:hypothetical protein n=1 Tax=Nonomuraea recticatena TaxID=46178 RepID=UPI003617B04F